MVGRSLDRGVAQSAEERASWRRGRPVFSVGAVGKRVS